MAALTNFITIGVAIMLPPALVGMFAQPREPSLVNRRMCVGFGRRSLSIL
jgi:hypothetical protein